LSKHYGATHTINNASEDAAVAVQGIFGGELADVVIEAVGVAETINLAIDLAKDYAFFLQFGVPHDRHIKINIRDLFSKCLHLKAIVMASREPNHTSTRMALDMIASGEVDVSPIVTHRFPFERVLDAYELQRTRVDGAIKIIVEMPEKKS
jgi:threonine dehydrogenase-like Zn-dependent dehydrogenase